MEALQSYSDVLKEALQVEVMIKLIAVLFMAMATSRIVSAKEPTILFLGPNGVRPLNAYGGGGGGGGMSDSGYGGGSSDSESSGGGGVFSMGGLGLSSVLSNFRGNRDQDSEDKPNFNIFRLGERFQERQQKQHQQKGPRIIVIPPIGGNSGPKPSPPRGYGGGYGGHYHPHSPYAAASNVHYTRSPYPYGPSAYGSSYSPSSYGHRYGYMAPQSPYQGVGQSVYGYGWQ